jgi:hypothetical protein
LSGLILIVHGLRALDPAGRPDPLRRLGLRRLPGTLHRGGAFLGVLEVAAHPHATFFVDARPRYRGRGVPFSSGAVAAGDGSDRGVPTQRPYRPTSPCPARGQGLRHHGERRRPPPVHGRAPGALLIEFAAAKTVRRFRPKPSSRPMCEAPSRRKMWA